MDAFFAELGRSVYSRWKKQNFSLLDFPKIAAKALEEMPPSRHVDATDLISDFLLNDEQPFQTTSGFGQPEIIVFDHPRFYIQLLFWLDGTTDIHQHSFSGAFHVMAGSSIHSEFVFEKARPVTAHFQVGDLRRQSTHLLETGSTVPIVSGGEHIHALFHLDSPSISVVVRTHNDPGTGPQFTYLPPHVALDPVRDDALTLRRKQLLDVLEQTGDPSYGDLVAEMMAGLDFESAFFILQNGIGHLRETGAWEKVWKIFAKKHGALARYVEPTLAEIIRRDSLVTMRGQVSGVDHRFFLALLLNVPDRKGILSLVGRRFSGPAWQTVLQWAEELAECTEESAWILDAEFPEGFDLVPEEQLPLFLDALRFFLTGRGAVKLDGRAIPASGLKAIRGAFEGSSLRVLLR